MKAMRFHEYGDPDVLQEDEVPVPEPGAGQVRLAVAGTAFNPVDANIRAGYMREPIPTTLPHVPGYDVAGTVDALGDGVDGLRVGDRVVGFLPMAGDGASAEYALAAADVLVAAPTSIPLADAAALPSVGLTAYQALFDHAGLRSGKRVLVSGAGGAVGRYVVQLAKAAGATVVATAGPRSREQLTAYGADEVVDHTATDDVAAAIEEPVDVLVNLAPLEPDAFARLVGRVADGGVVVSTTVWMPTPGDPDRGVRGIDLFVRSDTEQLADLVGRVDRGELHVDVDERVALADLPSVHARAAAGGVSGKVVVVVRRV